MTPEEAAQHRQALRALADRHRSDWSDGVVLRLVDAIYDAAGDSSRWTVFLEALQDALGGTVGYLHRVHLDDRTETAIASVRTDPSHLETLRAHYAATSPAYRDDRWRLLEAGIVGSLNMVIPNAEWASSEYVADWLRPQDAYYNLGATVTFAPTNISGLDLFRPPSADPFSGREMGLVAALMSHLQRAFDLHDTFEGFHQFTSTIDAALEEVPVGVAALDRRGSVVAVNRRARDVLAAGDGMRLEGGRVRGTSGVVDARLAGLVAGAVATGAGDARHAGGRLAVPRRCNPAHEVLVTPLRARDNALASKDVCALVIIGDLTTRVTTDAATLKAAFGLTSAECQVCECLATGMDVSAVGERLRLSRETVRTHAQRVYRKADARTQSDLIRTVSRVVRAVRTR